MGTVATHKVSNMTKKRGGRQMDVYDRLVIR
jgi:hypothetical protein